MAYFTEKRLLNPYPGPSDAPFWLLEALASLILGPPDCLLANYVNSVILTIIRENNNCHDRSAGISSTPGRDLVCQPSIGASMKAQEEGYGKD
jgi:hypothetical protein